MYADPFHIYSFHNFLLSETERVEAYRRAIRAVVKPGDVVLDAGAGVGILSFFALEAGARRVYAVECAPVAELARRVVAGNDADDRIVVIREMSFNLELPEKADVLVSDTLGSLGVETGLLGVVADARGRLVKEGGAFIPGMIAMHLAPLQCERVHRRAVGAWENRFGVDFSAIRPFAANTPAYDRFEPGDLLAPPAVVVRLEMASLAAPAGAGEVEVEVARDGLMHGLAGMFTADLGGGESLTNIPPGHNSNYTHAFLPLEEPVPVSAGDRLRLGLRCSQGTEWAWTVERLGGARPFRRSHATLLGFPLPEGYLRRRSSEFAPALSRKGEAGLHLLRSLDGKASLAELERDLLARFPDCFRTPGQAALFVREMSEQWTK